MGLKRPALSRNREQRGGDSALVLTHQEHVFPFPKSLPRPLLLPSPLRGTRIVKSHAVGFHGRLWAWCHHPNVLKEAPVTAYPRAPTSPAPFPGAGCRAPLAFGTRLQEGGTTSAGAPPRALKLLDGEVSIPDVARGPPAVRAPGPGLAAGESGWTRGKGWDLSLCADSTGNLKSSSRRGPTGSLICSA